MTGQRRRKSVTTTIRNLVNIWICIQSDDDRGERNKIYILAFDYCMNYLHVSTDLSSNRGSLSCQSQTSFAFLLGNSVHLTQHYKSRHY